MENRLNYESSAVLVPFGPLDSIEALGLDTDYISYLKKFGFDGDTSIGFYVRRMFDSVSGKENIQLYGERLFREVTKYDSLIKLIMFDEYTFFKNVLIDNGYMLSERDYYSPFVENAFIFDERFINETTSLSKVILDKEVLRKLNAVSVFTVSDFMEADHSLYPGYYNTYEESVILVNLSKFKSKFKGKVLEKRM